jgi:hypothetical protein
MKKIKVLRLFIVAIIFTVSLVIGCSNGINEIGTNEEGNTPFASQELLEDIATADRFVHWKVARFFALNELDDLRLENSWADAWLSEYPLVIYNAETGDPRYYEFRVLKGGKEAGAISCAVDKGEGSPVQYVLPFVHEIESQNARFVVNHTGKLVDSGYPGRLLVQKQYGRYSRSIDAVTGAESLSEYPVDAKALDVLLSATREDLERLGINSDEMYANYLAVEMEKAGQLGLFWQEVEELTDKIISMTEEELLEAFNTDSGAARSISTSYSGTYTLSDWVNKSAWDHQITYCGPNVIAFIILGLGPKSGYANLPTTNNKNQLVNYYETIESRMGKGPKLFHWFDGDSLNGWLINFTGGRYNLATHWGIPTIVSHNWNPINASIRGNQLPVISLRLPKITNISGGFHYRTIIGTRQATTNLKLKVLWWTVTVPLWSEGQYLMHDNESDFHNWWEGWSLYQFQAASVLRK